MPTLTDQLHEALIEQIITYGGAETYCGSASSGAEYTARNGVARVEFARVLDLATALRNLAEKES